jgi:hypothetical protein
MSSTGKPLKATGKHANNNYRVATCGGAFLLSLRTALGLSHATFTYETAVIDRTPVTGPNRCHETEPVLIGRNLYQVLNPPSPADLAIQQRTIQSKTRGKDEYFSLHKGPSCFSRAECQGKSVYSALLVVGFFAAV